MVRVFEIPVEAGMKIVHIPEIRSARLVQDGISVPKFLKASVSPALPERVADGTFRRCDLIVNNFCNLRCVYCHANSGEQPRRQMSFSVASQAINRVIEDVLLAKLPRFDVTLTGGGEPLLSLNLVRRIVEFCDLRAAQSGLQRKLAIVSNGCFPNRLRTFLATNFDNVSISIDGPPEIQNKQRPFANGKPSFGIVAENIDALRALGKIGIGFRMTVSAESVLRLEESVLFLHDRWPGIIIGIEPLEFTGRCLATNAQPPDLKVFAQHYVQILARAKKNGMQIRSSLATFKARTTRLSFCGVNGRIFGVDPDGDVTACTRVCSKQDPLAKEFHFGHITQNGSKPLISKSAYERLAHYIPDSVPQCCECYALSNCKGDCCHVRATVHGPHFVGVASHRCEGIRYLTRAILRMELGLPPEQEA